MTEFKGVSYWNLIFGTVSLNTQCFQLTYQVHSYIEYLFSDRRSILITTRSPFWGSLPVPVPMPRFSYLMIIEDLDITGPVLTSKWEGEKIEREEEEMQMGQKAEMNMVHNVNGMSTAYKCMSIQQV